MIDRNGDDEKRKDSFRFISLIMSLLKQTKKFHITAMKIMSERGSSSYHGWEKETRNSSLDMAFYRLFHLLSVTGKFR